MSRVGVHLTRGLDPRMGDNRSWKLSGLDIFRNASKTLSGNTHARSACTRDESKGMENSVQMFAVHNWQTDVWYTASPATKTQWDVCFLVRKMMSWQTGEEMFITHQRIWQLICEEHAGRSVHSSQHLRPHFCYKTSPQMTLLPTKAKTILTFLSIRRSLPYVNAI